ncbi:MAG: hypothetical protein PHP14_03455 [Candidatus Pacebacteria bacterium]|nr:hypothetical protein [Candidatus Paceibacterota bacterium]MDD3808339.1 hypothetical protein [Candidatus Paceibacterota bacterium]
MRHPVSPPYSLISTCFVPSFTKLERGVDMTVPGDDVLSQKYPS